MTTTTLFDSVVGLTAIHLPTNTRAQIVDVTVSPKIGHLYTLLIPADNQWGYAHASYDSKSVRVLQHTWQEELALMCISESATIGVTLAKVQKALAVVVTEYGEGWNKTRKVLPSEDYTLSLVQRMEGRGWVVRADGRWTIAEAGEAVLGRLHGD